MQNNAFSTNKTWNVRGRVFDLSTPRVMGILNVTPDSFYDGKKYSDHSAAVQHASRMIREGADIIDVGGYSSRPGAVDLPEDEELRRVIPVIQQITRQFPDTIISVDTFRSAVARQALDAGAAVINDISAGETDHDLPALASSMGVPYIVMHMRGNPQTMTHLTHYDDLVKEVTDYLRRKVYQLTELGIKDFAIDPGFGFAKTVDQNFLLLQNLDSLRIIGMPILAGLSRKSMIWRTLHSSADQALNGTTMLNTVALMKGASILRVHDVREARECVVLFGALSKGRIS